MATIYYPTTAVVQQRQVSGSTLTEQFIGVLPEQPISDPSVPEQPISDPLSIEKIL